MPVRTPSRRCLHEIQIHAFIDNAEEPEAWVGNFRLVLRFMPARQTSLAEMCCVDAGWKPMHAGMPVLLGLVEAHAARENEIGMLEQTSLHERQKHGRVLERGEFVHAIIDLGTRGQVRAERHCHRRVVPKDGRIARLGQHGVEQLSLRCHRGSLGKPYRQDRNGNADATRTLGHFEPGGRYIPDYRFFENNDPIGSGSAA